MSTPADRERQIVNAQRRAALAVVTTTDAEYRAKWETVNALTKRLAELSGGITKAMQKYSTR